MELRKSLRKRFDNVVNIDIKKIMKGGKEKEESVGEKPRRKKYEEC